MYNIYVYVYIYIYMYMYIYVCVCLCVCGIIITMCPPCYRHSGFVATHAIEHIRTSCAQEYE